MIGRPSRGWWTVLAVGCVVGAVLLVLLYGSPDRADLSGYWQLVVAVVALVVTLAPLAVRRARRGGAALDDLTEAVADEMSRWCAAAVPERGLAPHTPIPVRWFVDDTFGRLVAVGRRSTPDHPAGPALNTLSYRSDLAALQDMYESIRPDRMVIAGEAGAGKSSIAVLMMRDALNRRRIRDGGRADPVPVLLGAAGWDPRVPVRDWFVVQLRQNFPLLLSGAHGDLTERLVDDGRVLLVLDGLDEMPAALQPAALRQLMSAPVPWILLSRYDALDAVSRRGAELVGALTVGVAPVGLDDAVRYLRTVTPEPSRAGNGRDTARAALESAARCLERNRTGPLAMAVTTPLMLSLLRDTCTRDPEAGLELVGDEPGVTTAEIRIALLAQVLTNAYGRRHTSDREFAESTLRFVARAMEDDDDRERLAWWAVPGWGSALSRVVVVGAASGVVVTVGGFVATGGTALTGLEPVLYLGAGAAVGALIGARAAPVRAVPSRWYDVFARPWTVVGFAAVLAYCVQYSFGQWLGLAAAPVAFVVMAVALLVDRNRVGPDRAGSVPGGGPSRWRRRPASVFAAGLLAGVLLADAASIWFAAALAPLFGAASVFGLVLGLRMALAGPPATVDDPVESDRDLVEPGRVPTDTPYAHWRRWRGRSLAAWAAVGVVLGIAGMAAALSIDVAVVGYVLLPGLGFLSGVTLGAIFPETWITSLTCVELALRRRAPGQLMAFLEDARRRGVLRASGPYYQFRHEQLRAFLTGADAGPSDAGPTPAGTGPGTRRAILIGVAGASATWLGLSLLFSLPQLSLFGGLVAVAAALGCTAGVRFLPFRAVPGWLSSRVRPFASVLFGAALAWALVDDLVELVTGGVVIALCLAVCAGMVLWSAVQVMLKLGRTRSLTALERWRRLFPPHVVIGLGSGGLVLVVAVEAGMSQKAFFVIGFVLAVATVLVFLNGKPAAPDGDPGRSGFAGGAAPLVWFLMGGLTAAVAVRATMRLSVVFPEVPRVPVWWVIALVVTLGAGLALGRVASLVPWFATGRGDVGTGALVRSVGLPHVPTGSENLAPRSAE